MDTYLSSDEVQYMGKQVATGGSLTGLSKIILLNFLQLVLAGEGKATLHSFIF